MAVRLADGLGHAGCDVVDQVRHGCLRGRENQQILFADEARIGDPGDVHVRYCLTDSIGGRVLEAAVALLSDEERVRYERFRVDRDRHEFAVAHALLRTTLSELGDLPPGAWRFQTDTHGKPMLAAGTSTLPWSFNLSHARGLVACVVARGAEVGLDVELATRGTDWRGIASRYFSAAEVAQIDRLVDGERPTRFFELWTLKEA